MSGRSMRIIADPHRISMASAIRKMAEATPLVTVTHRALARLARELGGTDAAAAWLADLAEEIGRPISINVPTGEETSSTCFIPPKGWSRERLSGWIAGHHAELERAFGEVAGVRGIR